MIDARAVVSPEAQLAADVSVGPFSIIGAQVRMGPRCVVGPHAVISGPCSFGADNRVHPFASIGDAPQDKKYQGEPTRLEIGDRNVGEEAASLCSGATVTVRTPNIALLNFFKYSLERVGTRQHPLDIHELLSAYVVEVQHDWIGLAAVNTRVLREITVNRPGSEVSVVALVFLT